MEINWRTTERQVTTPVPSSHRSLANVKFRLDGNGDPVSDEVFYVETQQDWVGFNPELFMDVDVAALTSDTDLKHDDIALSVIVRDRDLGRFEAVQEWRLDDLPEDGWPLDGALDRFSRSLRLDISVVATPRISAVGADGASLLKGTLLAVKTFKIRSPSRALDFPFRIVEPEEMAKHPGLYRETVFYVHWRGEDVNRTPSELLEVWLNKEFEDKFRILNGKHGGIVQDHIGRNIAAHVYAEVLTHVLCSDEDGDEPTSLVAIVGDLAERQLGMSIEELRGIYREGPGGRSKLMPWCWRLSHADVAFAGLKL